MISAKSKYLRAFVYVSSRYYLIRDKKLPHHLHSYTNKKENALNSELTYRNIHFIDVEFEKENFSHLQDISSDYILNKYINNMMSVITNRYNNIRIYPIGFVNLGNTCYLNTGLQVKKINISSAY